MDPAEHESYIQKILGRYANPFIVDDVDRVGREPIRKLSPEDRLVKPLRGCMSLDLPHENLVKGIVMAMAYDNPEDPQSVQLRQLVADKGFEAALASVSGLDLEAGDFNTKLRIAADEVQQNTTIKT